ncbi:hypothetical protein BDZ45DRAFT_751478 [Acephala macrosclerotiorum]|nr:hypothetical protein BDZ45DRAFT_751478 [Acephala macrosclerotiorum]
MLDELCLILMSLMLDCSVLFRSILYIGKCLYSSFYFQVLKLVKLYFHESDCTLKTNQSTLWPPPTRIHSPTANYHFAGSGKSNAVSEYPGVWSKRISICETRKLDLRVCQPSITEYSTMIPTTTLDVIEKTKAIRDASGKRRLSASKPYASNPPNGISN